VDTGGDVVVGVNGLRVRSGDDLVRIVTNDLKPGMRAIFTVIRGDKRLEIPVVVTERPSGPSSG
jgi:S1-C subfamily serine protease